MGTSCELFLKGATCLTKFSGPDRVGQFKGAPVQQRRGRLGWGSPVEGRSGRKDEVVTKPVEMAFKACVAGRRGPARGGSGGRGRARARRRAGPAELSAVLSPPGAGAGGAVRRAEPHPSRGRRSCLRC